MVAGSRLGYDYFAGMKNDSKIRLVAPGPPPPVLTAISCPIRDGIGH
jgi:hypothetical protein